jgi:hypothetical protein
MQDQGKRLLLAVALALGVMFAWNALTGKKEEPPPDKGGSAETQKAEASPPSRRPRPSRSCRARPRR